MDVATWALIVAILAAIVAALGVAIQRSQQRKQIEPEVAKSAFTDDRREFSANRPPWIDAALSLYPENLHLPDTRSLTRPEWGP
jgi:hypothetical protein